MLDINEKLILQKYLVGVAERVNFKRNKVKKYESEPALESEKIKEELRNNRKDNPTQRKSVA